MANYDPIAIVDVGALMFEPCHMDEVEFHAPPRESKSKRWLSFQPFSGFCHFPFRNWHIWSCLAHLAHLAHSIMTDDSRMTDIFSWRVNVLRVCNLGSEVGICPGVKISTSRREDASTWLSEHSAQWDSFTLRWFRNVSWVKWCKMCKTWQTNTRDQWDQRAAVTVIGQLVRYHVAKWCGPKTVDLEHWPLFPYVSI